MRNLICVCGVFLAMRVFAQDAVPVDYDGGGDVRGGDDGPILD